MGLRARPGLVRAAAIVLLFAVVLSGTAVADSLVPDTRRGGAGEEIGRAGFAYLTGVRTFAAAVLWNRIDPIFHGYYSGVSLTEQTFVLPTVYLAVTLDPQLEQPYYVASWILAQGGALEEGVELARKGVENNPRSGLMRAGYAQILWLLDNDLEAAFAHTSVGLSEETEWRSLDERYDGYVVFRDVLRIAGHEARAEQVVEELRFMESEIDRPGVDVDPAH